MCPESSQAPQECCLRVSLMPLRLNIDQVKMFLLHQSWATHFSWLKITLLCFVFLVLWRMHCSSWRTSSPVLLAKWSFSQHRHKKVKYTASAIKVRHWVYFLTHLYFVSQLSVFPSKKEPLQRSVAASPNTLTLATTQPRSSRCPLTEVWATTASPAGRKWLTVNPRRPPSQTSPYFLGWCHLPGWI